MNNLQVIFELAALLGVLALGSALALWRTLPGIVRTSGAVLVAGGLGVWTWAVVWGAQHPTDLNPTVADRDIVGRWTCKWGTLAVNKDGSFVLGESPQWNGTWKRQDWNLDLRDQSGRSEYWRVVRVNTTPVLLRGWKDPAAPWPPECTRQ